MNIDSLDIALLRLNSEYTTKLDLISIDGLYEEKVSDIPKTIWKVIDTIYTVFCDYITELSKLHKNKKDRKYMETTIKNVKKAIKSCPKLKEQVIYIDTGFDIIDKKASHTEDQLDKLGINLANAVRLRDDDRMNELIQNYYMVRRVDSTEEVYKYKMNIGRAIERIEEGIERVDKKIEENKKFLLNFKNHFIEVYKDEHESKIINDFTGIVKYLQLMISKFILVFYFNTEDIFRQVHDVTLDMVKQGGKKYVKKVSPTNEDIIKESNLVRKVKLNGKEYEVYQTKFEDVPAMIVGDQFIFVDKNFFNQPKSFQYAILFHEIGHSMSGHFDNKTVLDNRKLEKRFRKETKKYDRIVWFSDWYDVKRLGDDTELVYILVELEADRFSSKFVGKRMMKRALDERFTRHIKSLGLEKNLEEYNLFRNKIRLKMI